MGRGPSIEGRKNAEDSRRGKMFTKFIREITVAARAGADPASNSRLRLGIEKALASNMTKETIERAIRRGSGADGGAAVEEIRYEGYGPGGVAIIIDTLTDNPVRTVADVRHALTKHGGNLGTTGSVAFQFDHRGELYFDVPDSASEERIMELALDAGADDVQTEDGQSLVLCSPGQFEAVRGAMTEAGLEPVHADVVMAAQNPVEVSPDLVDDLQDLLDRLDGLDDVQEVFHNGVMPEEQG